MASGPVDLTMCREAACTRMPDPWFRRPEKGTRSESGALSDDARCPAAVRLRIWRLGFRIPRGAPPKPLVSGPVIGPLNASRSSDCDPIATPVGGTADTAATPCDPIAHTDAASAEVEAPPAAACWPAPTAPAIARQPTRRGRVPMPSIVGLSALVTAPRGGGAAAPSGALRAIDPSARPRSWRTFGPRRLRRQSMPALVATFRSAARLPVSQPTSTGRSGAALVTALSVMKLGERAYALCRIALARSEL
jgi:hypothetical protein